MARHLDTVRVGRGARRNSLPVSMKEEPGVFRASKRASSEMNRFAAPTGAVRGNELSSTKTGSQARDVRVKLSGSRLSSLPGQNPNRPNHRDAALDDLILQFEASVCELVEANETGVGTGQAHLLRRARQFLALNRHCVREFGDAFQTPPLNIMLEVFLSVSEGKLTPVKNVCLAACTSQSTALRWLDRLEQSGLLVRRRDDSDARRILLDLTDNGYEALCRLLSAA